MLQGTVLNVDDMVKQLEKKQAKTPVKASGSGQSKIKSGM